ncbi:hypothetical protein [Streptomyces iconiensis]|uniref:Scaffolding protein n=1 Tax=Streptomyces iconiensis TaxID=1384038 RepID=A0ABT7A4I8_9ACTN|nr:hypothetical protein [Streptomyces iconiensis]MDJ1136221.1 hypothetical protein [Streptomyces iconiensis]
MSTPTPAASAPAATPAADPSGQTPASAPAPAPAAPASASAEPIAGQSAEGDETALPAWAQKALSDARAEAGKTRVTAKQKAADEARADLAQQIGKALGLVDNDTPPDPAALTQQLTTAQTQARQTAVELAVYRTAREAGGDPDALLDSRQFADTLADVDPTDTAAVSAAVEAAVTANPKLAAAPSGPPRGGAEFTGPPTGERKPASLHDAIAARLGG